VRGPLGPYKPSAMACSKAVFMLYVAILCCFCIYVSGWEMDSVNSRSAAVAIVAAATQLNVCVFGAPLVAEAKTDLPALEKCFNAIRKELDPIEGDSLKRINTDIETSNWDDLKQFTREYDAGFRGGVLKSAWKQLGADKQAGIALSNSFTFDLIALNKAARTEDKPAALEVAKLVRTDLENFLKLEKK